MRSAALRGLSRLPGLLEGNLPASSAVSAGKTRPKHGGKVTGAKVTGVTYAKQQRNYSSNVVQPDLILRSPLAEQPIPDDVTVHGEIFKACDQYKDRIAMEEFLTGKKISFTDLKETSIRVASSLHKMGYRKGDVVVAFSINCIDFTVLGLACSLLGLWFSPANATFTPGELARQIELSGACAVFTSDILSPIVTAALADVDKSKNIKDRFSFGEVEGYRPFSSLVSGGEGTLPDISINSNDDIFTLPYSSGTTGLPKGVMLSQKNVAGNIIQMGSDVYAPGQDTVIGLLPFSHIYGLTVNLLTSLSQGGTIVTLPKFEPEWFLKCLMMKQITIAPLVPPLILFLAKHPVAAKFDLSSVREFFSAAAYLGPDLTDEFLARHKHGCRILQGYGLTETSPAISTDTKGIKGSVGFLVPHTIGKMVDPDTRQIVGPGQEGEFWIKGPQVMKGYHNNEAATREMVTEDGWLQTGDLAYYNEDGTIHICERLKELIKYKGSQVSPAELESLLLSHPGVADAAVIGVPDDIAGELPRAYVVKQPGQEVDEKVLVEFVKGQVSKAKQLRGGVEFMEAIPKNPSGKILRRVLRAKAKGE